MNPIPWSPTPKSALKHCVLEHRDEDGAIELYRPIPTVFFCRMQGHFSQSHADLAARCSSTSTLADDAIHYYSDWSLMTSYDSEARKIMTEWGKRERHRLKSGFFVCGNRIVEMGVNVAGLAMALLGIQVQAISAEDFQTALRERINAEPLHSPLEF